MTCSEFIEGFSDYVDGVAEPDAMEGAELHLQACESCRRYEHTYRRGISLLRSFSDLTVHDGFEPDLERRLRRDTALALQSLGRRPASSGSSMTMVLGMALVLVGAAWSRGELVSEDLWDEPSSLFRQYAPVLRGYTAGGARLGLD